MVRNLYDCRYKEFFKALALVEQELKNDWLAKEHYRFIVRELRIRAYNQLLAAYKSLSLDNMAVAFGVTASFLDNELENLVSSGRVGCTIDQVSGIVTTTLVDPKEEQYRLIIQKSDQIMDQMHKLAHFVQ